MKNRKRYALIGVGAAIAGIFFGLLGFYFLEKEGLDYVFSVYLALAGICLIAELVMLIKSGHLQEKELEEWCASLTAVMLPPLSRDFVLETFQNHGFRFLDSEIFMKKTLWRLGYVSCYVRWLSVQCDTEEMLSETLSSALDGVIAWEQRDKRLEKGYSCMFLFLELEDINDTVMLNIPAMEMELMRSSFTKPFRKEKAKTLIVIPTDRASGHGHFWSQPVGPNVYAHGCRLLNKYFQPNTVSAAGR